MPPPHPSALLFAANTSLGKTVLSAGLFLAAQRQNLNPMYLKPVQTGGRVVDQDSIGKWTRNTIRSRTLFAYDAPKSPHLAAREHFNSSGERPPTGREIRDAIAANLSMDGFNIIESAGGVLSPCPDGTLQADVLRLVPNCRTVLVGDGQLGGISTTLTALEALLNRGFDLVSIVIFASDAHESYFGNCGFLSAQLPTPIHRISALPNDSNVDLNDFFASNETQKQFSMILANVLKGVPERGEEEDDFDNSTKK